MHVMIPRVTFSAVPAFFTNRGAHCVTMYLPGHNSLPAHVKWSPLLGPQRLIGPNSSLIGSAEIG